MLRLPKERPEALAVFRITLSIFLLIQFYQNYEYLVFFNNQFGVPEISHSLSPNWIFWFDFVIESLCIDRDVFLKSINILYAICLVFILLGICVRPAAFIALIVQVSLKHEMYSSSYGAYEFATIGLFYCVILPVSDSFFMGNVGRKFPQKKMEIYFISYVLLRGHMSIVYVSAFFEKIIGEQWRNGEALWRALARPTSFGDNIYWLAEHSWIALLICWFVLLIQLLYPLFLFTSTTRLLLLILIEMFHLGIAVSLDLWIFSGVMLALNLGALLNSKSIRRMVGYHAGGRIIKRVTGSAYAG